MIRGRAVAGAVFGTMTLLGCLASAAHAAQCGSSSAGFETWKREFSAEAQGKGVGQTALSALMQTNYASATIAADRGQRSFSLSLDQFLAKRGATPSSPRVASSSSRRPPCLPRSSSAMASRRGR